MILPCPKRPRLQLDPEAYQQLHQQVLRRDGWRCQQCGSRTNLQVHHIKPRTQAGDDVEENLITLCSECHRGLHTMVSKGS
jgi:5-methylcytosine-specific restriction endonuclease McrA